MGSPTSVATSTFSAATLAGTLSSDISSIVWYLVQVLLTHPDLWLLLIVATQVSINSTIMSYYFLINIMFTCNLFS